MLKDKLKEIAEKIIEENIKKDEKKAEIWFNKVIKDISIKMEKKAKKGQYYIEVKLDKFYGRESEGIFKFNLIKEWAEEEGFKIKENGTKNGVIIKWI